MDYLQRATERARQERDGRLGRTTDPTIPLFGANEPPPAGAAIQKHERDTNPHPGGQLPLPAEVQYTNTRQVVPDDTTLSRNRIIAGDAYDPRVEVYRQLRSQVLGAMHRKKWRTLAVTSPHEDAGKTLTTLNLAIAMSQEVNQTVMLVDLDLRKPDLHRALGVPAEAGLIEHLHHGVKLDDILINPGFPRLVLLPCLPQGRHVSELLTSPEMRSFLTEVTNRYPDRLVIFDLPPLLRNDDAMAFVPSVDCCLLVVEDGVTTPEQLERSRALLRHTNLLGTVLNKSR
ncbi:MAG: exopolysaccharide biosynthesis protein [Pseudomonadota bacterium]